MSNLSIQERYAPRNHCFGCGPANEKGLRIRSFPAADGLVVCEWKAEPHHEAFPGVLNGGIIGSLLDCHSIWTAAHHIMVRDQLEAAPCCVTADFHVKLRKPTPSKETLRIEARVIEDQGQAAIVEAKLIAGEKVTATCTGKFVAVKEDHPAFHRW